MRIWVKSFVPKAKNFNYSIARRSVLESRCRSFNHRPYLEMDSILNLGFLNFLEFSLQFLKPETSESHQLCIQNYQRKHDPWPERHQIALCSCSSFFVRASFIISSPDDRSDLKIIDLRINQTESAGSGVLTLDYVL